jgi:hypothetical protein
MDWTGTVKPATRDAIISEIERAFIVAGARDYDSGIEVFQKLLDWAQTTYHPMRSKEHLAALLNSMPEPSWLRKQMMLGSLRQVPQLIRFGLKRLALIAEDALPAIPSGRPGLDAFSKAQIVAHVGKKHIAGYTLDQAKRSAAQRFGVSESSIQRAWDDRGNRGEIDFRSVLKFLDEDMKDQSDVLDSMDRIER